MANSEKIALITGVTGQDGSYLAEFLLNKGYEVHGMVRQSAHFNRNFVENTREKARQKGQVFEFHYGDLTDTGSLYRVLLKIKPTEIYNLAAQSHVGLSFNEPELATETNATGVLRLLETIRQVHPGCRFYQASSSELFGNAAQAPQCEETPFNPRSPYAIAKLYAFYMTRNYREAYGMHASNGILFNHESPRRGENYVTRKITYSLARIKAGQQDVLTLGNLDAKRDWGFAGDYVKAMWLMLQQDKPDDYVIATGKLHSVRNFVEKAAGFAGFDIRWKGEGPDELGIDHTTGRTLVEIDPSYFRPTDIQETVGDAGKARQKLGWQPDVDFEELVGMMMEADLAE